MMTLEDLRNAEGGLNTELSPMEIAQMIANLEPKDRQVLEVMVEGIVTALFSGTGTAVLMVDAKGEGSAAIIAAGNPLLIQPLLATAAVVSDKLFATPPGMVQ